MLFPEKLEHDLCQKYPILEEAVETFRKEMVDDWPSWCYLPMGASLTIVTYPLPNALVKVVASDKRVRDSMRRIAAIIPWRVNRAVYRFSLDLAAKLMDISIDQSTSPVPDLLRMPCPGIFIESPPACPDCLGVFYFLEFDKRYPGVVELRAHYMFPKNEIISFLWQLDENGVMDTTYQFKREVEDERTRETVEEMKERINEIFEMVTGAKAPLEEPVDSDDAPSVYGKHAQKVANRHLQLLLHLCRNHPKATGHDGKCTIYFVE